jgi:Anti-sigma-K factor rskA
MTREHDLIEELVAVRALGGLEPADAERLRAEMASHGPDCEQCRALEADYADVAGGLAFALEPVAVRPGFAQETFDRALGGGGPAPVDLGAERERRRDVLRPLLGIAAAFVLFVGGWVVGVSVTEDEPALTEATTVSFEGEGGGAISAAYRPGEPGMFLLGDDLPALPENRVYELWVFEGETPVSALCARPSEDGSLFEFVDTSLEGVGLMAVTVEPASCPDAPTTDPIFTAEVATV